MKPYVTVKHAFSRLQYRQKCAGCGAWTRLHRGAELRAAAPELHHGEQGEREVDEEEEQQEVVEVLERNPERVHLVPSPCSIEGGKIEAKRVLHTVLGGS